MEAQRYPADFDGIVAIAPWVNPLEWAAAVVRNLQAQYPTGTLGAPAVTPAVLRLLAAKVTEACDAIDRVRDGILENPDAGRGTIAHHRAQTPRHAGGTNASAVCVRDDGEIQRYRLKAELLKLRSTLENDVSGREHVRSERTAVCMFLGKVRPYGRRWVDEDLCGDVVAEEALDSPTERRVMDHVNVQITGAVRRTADDRTRRDDAHGIHLAANERG